MRALMIVLVLFSSSQALAKKDHVGVIARLSGKAYLYKNRSKKAKGPSPRVQLDKYFYTRVPAKRGARIRNHYVIQTEKKSKLRIIYSNGDSFSVGPDTFYKIKWKKDGSPTINMVFGKIRGLILKGGPRKNLKVVRQTSTLGVRGTDFFVAGFGTNTKVSVIRGEVDLKKGKQKKVVKSGFSTQVSNAKELPKSKPTTKEDLLVIAHVSKVEKAPKKEKVDAKTQEELQKLEEKARDNVLLDIKKTEPEKYKVIAKNLKQMESLDDVNQIVVKDSYKTAPSKKKGPQTVRRGVRKPK